MSAEYICQAAETFVNDHQFDYIIIGKSVLYFISPRDMGVGEAATLFPFYFVGERGASCPLGLISCRVGLPLCAEFSFIVHVQLS